MVSFSNYGCFENLAGGLLLTPVGIWLGLAKLVHNGHALDDSTKNQLRDAAAVRGVNVVV